MRKQTLQTLLVHSFAKPYKHENALVLGLNIEQSLSIVGAFEGCGAGGMC